jgi:hypothetical protein
MAAAVKERVELWRAKASLFGATEERFKVRHAIKVGGADLFYVCVGEALCPLLEQPTRDLGSTYAAAVKAFGDAGSYFVHALAGFDGD